MSWSDDELDRFEEMALLLEGAPIATHLVTRPEAFNWTARPGAPLEVELANTEVGPGGPWGSEPVMHARTQAQFWLLMAGFDLRACGSILRHDTDRIGGPWSTVRSAVERCSAGLWMVDPRASVRERVARAFLVELEDRRQVRNAAAYGAGAEPGSQSSPEEDAYQEFLNVQIPDHFYGTEIGLDRRGRPAKLVEQRLLGYSEMVGELTETYIRGGEGRHAYALLSENAHPSVSAYLALLQPAGDGVQLSETLERLENLVRLGCLVHYKLLAQTCEWFGWLPSGDVLQFRQDQLNEVFPSVIT